jgi:hypothetical protein
MILGAACGMGVCVFIGASRRACYRIRQIKPTEALAKDFAGLPTFVPEQI